MRKCCSASSPLLWPFLTVTGNKSSIESAYGNVCWFISSHNGNYFAKCWINLSIFKYPAIFFLCRITIVLMIFVNDGAGQYFIFQHATWNGLQLADVIFPWYKFCLLKNSTRWIIMRPFISGLCGSWAFACPSLLDPPCVARRVGWPSLPAFYGVRVYFSSWASWTIHSVAPSTWAGWEFQAYSSASPSLT